MRAGRGRADRRVALTALATQANYTMASYSTMNTIPAADVESETSDGRAPEPVRQAVHRRQGL